MSTTPSATKRAIDAAEFAHGVLTAALSDFPADKTTFQTSPSDNHLLWHLGHMVTSYAWFASTLDGKPVGISEADNALFGMGSKPLADAKKYPSASELRKRYDEAWRRFAAAAKALREEDATKPPLVETGGFLKDRLDAVEKVAWHDGWHAGQVAGLRKALGLKGVF